MRRQSFLAAASLTVVVVAGTAVLSAARAQAVPVTFGTDPGAAHPRYAEAMDYRDRPKEAALSEAQYEIEARPAAVVVEAGDTVYGIARRHGIAPGALIEANGLEAPYTLALGQTLSLPGAVASEPAVTAALPESAPEMAPEASPAPEAEATPRRLAKAQNGLTQRIEKLDERDSLDSLYTVRRGDTLFALSRRFEIDVEDLAAANDIDAPYGLALGQRIVIPAPGEAMMLAAGAPEAAEAEAAPDADLSAPAARRASAPEPKIASADFKATGSRFAWPLEGPIVGSYGTAIDGQKNDGIDIAAPVGAPIRAAADGDVVYKGDELAGYGNLVLIKHEDGWVSAYAHADTIVVDKGDRVRQGQIIAKVGETGDVSGPQLHFELRHDLRPQDPIAALEGRLDTALVQVGYDR